MKWGCRRYCDKDHGEVARVLAEQERKVIDMARRLLRLEAATSVYQATVEEEGGPKT